MKPLIVTPFVALLVTGEALAAERRRQGSGVVVRGAAGLGVGRIDVAGENETEPGFAGGALFGVAGPRFEFDVEMAFQPFKVDNPAGRESFRVLYVLPSVRFHGRHAYLRLGAGCQKQADGKWKMTVISFNSDLPLAGAPAPKQ